MPETSEGPPRRVAGQQRALILVRDTRGSAVKWARRGLGPVVVVPGLAWTLVVPAGPARSAPPYDDELAILGGRPVPRSLRPCAVLVADEDRLAIQVQGPSWRAVARWLVWTRGVGLTKVPDLATAPPQLVARLLAPTRTSGDRLVAVLARDGRPPARVADELLEALALPGVGVLTGALEVATLPGATRVEPEEHRVARFDAHVADQQRARPPRPDGPGRR